MEVNFPEKRLETLLAQADIKIGGDRPWDIQVHNDQFYKRVLSSGELGLGESYMDSWWDCESLDGLICRILTIGLQEKVSSKVAAIASIKARLINLQTGSRAFQVAEHHYDIGNDLFENMLDERMIYSCGYWKAARTLDQAQESKLELICKKLGLKKGMRVLDVGCGWGGTAKYVAEHYNAEVVGATVSKEQTDLAREVCRGLPIEIQLKDYRDVEGKYDRILSVGMFEHVGRKNYRTFMKTMRRLLRDDGLFLLHTIGANRATRVINAWTSRYIFPNSYIPSPAEIADCIEGNFVIEDWHNFGADYDHTLMSWYRNFENAWPHLKENYPERFYRMWRYFLLTSAGSFRARHRQLWQIVLSPQGVSGVYHAPR